MADRWEWVEIIEPRTKEHMYANLASGECVWDPPPGVKIKQTDDNQWWELFDQNTSRFYYYNATSQKTVWHRPQNCDIIPLAKLQTLKQNTEVRDENNETDECKPVKCEISTQTPVPTPRREHHVRTGSLKSTGQSQTSPRGPRKHRFYRQDSSSSQSNSSHHESLRERPVNGERVHRRGSQPAQSTQAGYVSSPSMQSGIVRRESMEMSPRIVESPRMHRAHSFQKNVCDIIRPPSRTGSLHYVEIHARDDSYIPHYAYAQPNRQGSFSEREVQYGSRSDTYTPPSRYDTYTPPMGHIRRDGYVPDLHERLYSPVLPMSNMGSGNEECIAFSQDIVNQQGNISPIPHKPKPRSFPRTNPAYVGIPKRDGQTAYKRINVENQMPCDQVYSQDVSPYGTPTFQMVQHPQEYVDGYYYKPDRSDSDASYSSIRAYRHDRTDSQASQSSKNRDLSDSQSSQGSLRNVSDMHSSQSSLRALQDSAVSFQDSMSSKGSGKSMEQDITGNHERSGSRVSQQSDKISDNLNKEPIYENSSTIQSKLMANFPTTFECNNVKNLLKDSAKIEDFDVDHFTDDMPSADSMSPQEYGSQQGTPRSQRSIIMQNSCYNSEGIDQGFEESDQSSLFSGSPKTRPKPSPVSSVLQESHHASLKRKNYEKGEQPGSSPVLEKSHSLQAELAQQRPLSMVVPSQSEANVSLSPSIGSLNRQMRAQMSAPFGSASNLSQMQKLPSDSDIESYAQHHMNRHKKGIFGKKVSFANMLTWSKELIQKPMLRTNDKNTKKEACEMFRLIQMYMGDRKSRSTAIAVALEITIKGWSMVCLRDEIFVQLCRQTTENKREESLQKGWELLSICLNFFPPTLKFYSYLEGYISRHLDKTFDTPNVPISHFAFHCQRRLERMMQSGAKKGVRKPTLDEIEQAKKSIFHPSMFGSTLEDVMLMQKERYADRKLPWIQTVLSEEVLRLNGAQIEGIFRVPGDIDEVNALKIRCDQWIAPSDCPDPHIPASLLKLWYRELYEPLIPACFYEDCIENYANPENAVEVVNSLPEINRLVLAYLIRFLQVFAAEDNATVTKMDVNNLAMVMAPNCLRCESDIPSIIFENTRKEMGFIRTLIQNLDTSFMEGIV